VGEVVIAQGIESLLEKSPGALLATPGNSILAVMVVVK
jgi:hypothetical protein